MKPDGQIGPSAKQGIPGTAAVSLAAARLLLGPSCKSGRQVAAGGVGPAPATRSGIAARCGESSWGSPRSASSSSTESRATWLMGWTFMDAFYQVFITISAVGLTEVHPLVTTPLRLHTMLVIALGLFSRGVHAGRFPLAAHRGRVPEIPGTSTHDEADRDAVGPHDRRRIRPGRGPGLRRTGRASEMPFVIIEQEQGRVSEMEARGLPPPGRRRDR